MEMIWAQPEIVLEEQLARLGGLGIVDQGPFTGAGMKSFKLTLEMV